jgi:hypothetical protein
MTYRYSEFFSVGATIDRDGILGRIGLWRIKFEGHLEKGAGIGHLPFEFSDDRYGAFELYRILFT